MSNRKITVENMEITNGMLKMQEVANAPQKGSVCCDTIATSNNDRVDHPHHYTWLKDLCGIEVIDIIRHMDFCLGNAIKYILRAGHKSEEGMSDLDKTIEDLKKAVFYINDKINTLENERNNQRKNKC